MKGFQDKRLILVFLLALAVRVMYVISLDPDSVGPVDAPNYDALAMNLKSGHGLQAEGPLSESWYSFRAPLFPLFLVSIYTTFGHRYLAARLCLAIVSSLTCIIIYRIGKGVFNGKVAILSALGMAIYPKFIYYSGFLIPETVYIFLIALTITSLIELWKQPSFARCALSGIFFGLAALTKATIFYFLPFIFVWIVMVSQDKGRAVRSFLTILSFVIITMSPWVIRNYVVHRQITFTTFEAGYNLWLAHNPSSLAREKGLVKKDHSYAPEDESTFKNLPEADRDRLFRKQALLFIKENPSEFLKCAGIQFVNFWRFSPRAKYVERKYVVIGLFSFGPLLLLSLLGIIVSLKEWRRVLLFDLLIIYYTAVHMLFAVVTRYRVPSVPFFLFPTP